MKPNDLVVRCYALERDGHWSAVCIDLCLAAQGSSFAEVKRKLDEQVDEYVTEALTVDSANAEYLLTRKAPIGQRFIWHWLSARNHFRAFRAASARIFATPLPMVPAHNHC